ncbi:hypothetical protein DYB37_008422 [Aphanomyces astaci]|uniref:Uncharacterized protein n=1 Tax=Aphanomyces astaci TaxID=112090 RepID=A0A3R6YEC3_APHAT|nr:hypothetical protein DYB37_008422 [Aphanomyces astaci]
MSDAVLATPAVSAPLDTGNLKATSINAITDTFGKQSVGATSASKGAEVSTGSPLSSSIYVRIGDSIQLAAKSPEGELGRVRFVVDSAIRQTILVAPPIQEGISSELATFIIAPVGGAEAGSELSYNQLFTLQFAGSGGAPVSSLNSNPPGMSDGIGLQEFGVKGEMTFMFKGKDPSKIQFNDANLVLTCHDANRTRKNFNNVVTILKKSKTSGHGGFLTTAKKGPAITFTVTRPNVVPAARSDAIRSEAATVVVSEVGRTTDSFSAAVKSPLPPTPSDSFSKVDDEIVLPYVPPTLPPAPSLSKRPSFAVVSTPLKEIPLTPAPVQPADAPATASITVKQDSRDEGDVVVVRNTSPAVQDSKADGVKPLGGGEKALPSNSKLDSLLNLAPHQPHHPSSMTKADVDLKAKKWLGDSSQELSEIQQSVERLKLQRLQLERLQGVEGENERLRSRVLQVEFKLEQVDAAFRDQRQQLQDAIDTREVLELRWREAMESLQNVVEETTRTYESKLKLMEHDLETRMAKIGELEVVVGDTKATAERREGKLELKISQLEATNLSLEKQAATGSASWEAERARLLNDLAAADSKDRMTKFLKRKTAMHKAQTELEARNKALEDHIKQQQTESAREVQTLQALIQVDFRNHWRLGRVQNKALVKREKKMLGDVTELSMALRVRLNVAVDHVLLTQVPQDISDEKRVLEDKVKSLLGKFVLVYNMNR